MADINTPDTIENEAPEQTLVSVEMLKELVKNSYDKCKVKAKNLKDEYKAYCQTAKKAQSNPKTYATRLSSAKRRLETARAEYDAAISEHNRNIDAVLDEYRSIFMQSNRAKRVKREAERYVESQDKLLDRLSEFVSEAQQLSSSENFCESESDLIEATSALDKSDNSSNRQPLQYYVPVPQPKISVSPVNIDITEMVQEAVATALDKLNESLEKRISEHLDSVIAKDEKTQNLSPVSNFAIEIAENSAEDQRYVVEKLSGVADGIKELISSVSELSLAYVELSQRQKEAIALQRQINDTHRALTREIEGLQVNQKLITQEQASIAEDQIKVIEQQKAAAEKQKIIIEQSSSITELQATAQEAQSLLENSVKEALSVQKELISTHNSLMGSANKLREQQAELMRRQAELTDLQRNAMSEQKALAKAQRAVNDKIRAKLDKAAPVSKKSEGFVAEENS